jgi:(2Fe-2S) ferredoxin
MAGLVPAISLSHAHTMRQFFVCILASRPGGAIYVGVTNDLVRRIYEHKNKIIKGSPPDTGSTRSSASRRMILRMRPSNAKRISSTARVRGKRV